MNPFFSLVGVLLLSAPLLADETGAPKTLAAKEKSGLELLCEAGSKLVFPREGEPSLFEPNLSPEELLRRKRLAVARNAPALALARQAIALPIVVPAEEPPASFSILAQARELGRHFSYESDVRLADGDFVGAMNSRLDTMELGAAFGSGSVINSLTGLAIEAMGVVNAPKAAARLDAKTCRLAAARMEKIEARRRSLSQVFRDEQSNSLKMALSQLAEAQKGAPNNQQEIRAAEEDGITPQNIERFRTLSSEQLAKDHARVFDALVAGAQLPYSNTPPVMPPAGELNLLTRASLSFWAEGGNPRVNFARADAGHRLLRAALELRATKLETGAYPSEFNAPLDPFSPDNQLLRYHKTIDGFLLYSVGPDGRDDGGTPFKTIVTDEKTKVQKERKVLLKNSSGDVVQAPL